MTVICNLVSGGMGPLAVLGSILSYEICFSLSLGPGFFVVASELLPDVHRAQGLAMALLLGRLVACAMVFTFELNAALLTLSGTFFAYALFMISGAIFVYRSLPETVGRTFAEIQSELDRG